MAGSEAQDTITATSAHQPDHPKLAPRLLPKHHPRRRLAACAPPPVPKATRDQPDLSLCHCCGVRFPPRPPAAGKRRPVRLLRSLWRVVFLCPPCLSLVQSASLCSYCLSLDNLSPAVPSVTCFHCRRCVHLSCIPNVHRILPIQRADVQNFVCVDCSPIPRPGCKDVDVVSTPDLEAAARDANSEARRKAEAAAIARENAMRKATTAKLAIKQAKDALGTVFVGGGDGSEGEGGDGVVPDEKLALQLHLAMNGSQRISRSGSLRRCRGLAGPGRGRKGALRRRERYENDEVCVTNESLLDVIEDGVELGGNIEAEPVRLFGSSNSVVLALESVRPKCTLESMTAKRKGSSRAEQENSVCLDI